MADTMRQPGVEEKIAHESTETIPPPNPSDEESAQEIYIDPVLEKEIMRKFDFFVLPQFAILNILSFLDRANVGNARIFGFEEDVGRVRNQFGNLVTVFYVGLVVFVVPWVMAIKRYDANLILSIAALGWSICTFSIAWLHNYGQILAMRFMIGFFEAALFSSLTFLVSTIYNRESQGKRVAVLYASSALSGAFGGLIAYGIQIRGNTRGILAWRWLFIVEGIISTTFSLIIFFSMPSKAEKAWFLGEEERALMRARKEKFKAYNGDDKFDWKWVRMAVLDPITYLAGISLFAASVPMYGFSTFLPTILRGMGYSSLEANYLTIPVYCWAVVCLFIWLYFSDRFGRRSIIGVLTPIPVIAGYAIVVGTGNNGVGFFSMFLCASGIYAFNANLFTWAANNIKPDLKRSVSIPLISSIASSSGFVSSQIYPPSQGPRYIQGNAISLAMEAVAGICIVLMVLVYKYRNRQKAKHAEQGSTDNGKESDEGLDFKYII